jgi:amidohydrolase
VKAHHDELVALRRDLHAHPELSWAETRTTRLVHERLLAAGLRPRLLPGGTGLVCDVGTGSRVIGLRADLDALPIVDEKASPTLTVPGACHACGHDVHTTALLGAGLVLAALADEGLFRGAPG